MIWSELGADIARARGAALDADGQLLWDVAHGVGDARQFWRLVAFDAEHEEDRLDHQLELDRIARERRSAERKARAAMLPPRAPNGLTLEEALGRLERVRRSGEGWIARCPAHDDRAPSLRVVESELRPGEPLFHCYAGCHWSAVKDALR